VLRYYIKKSARVAMTLASGLSGSLLVRRLLLPKGVRALTCHRFGVAAHDPFCVTPAEFDRQIKLLAAEGRAVSLRQLEDFVAGRQSLPQDACLVTIDDGMLSTLTQALPVLERHAVPAVAFVSSQLVGFEAAVHGERYLTWAELRRLADSGLVEIGSHAHTHRSLGGLDVHEARHEIIESRRIIESELGRAVRSFAYPFGTFGDYNAATEAAIVEAGYAIAFNSVHGVIRPGMGPASLPRVKVEGGDPGFVFASLCRGGMDAWSLVDRKLRHLQSPRPTAA